MELTKLVTCTLFPSLTHIFSSFFHFFQHELFRATKEKSQNENSNKTLPFHKHYAYDIALIKLSKPVDLASPYSRAICLPGDAKQGQYPTENNNPFMKKKNTAFQDKSNAQDPNREGYFNHIRNFPRPPVYYGNIFNRIRRQVSDNEDNHVDLLEVERNGVCWVTGWGETKGSFIISLLFYRWFDVIM